MQRRDCERIGKAIAGLLQTGHTESARNLWRNVTAYSIQTQGDTWGFAYNRLLDLGVERKKITPLLDTIRS